jgi:hypothetical protein
MQVTLLIMSLLVMTVLKHQIQATLLKMALLVMMVLITLNTGDFSYNYLTCNDGTYKTKYR